MAGKEMSTRRSNNNKRPRSATVTPTLSGIKREFSNDDECGEDQRRVLPRTDQATLSGIKREFSNDDECGEDPRRVVPRTDQATLSGMKHEFSNDDECGEDPRRVVARTDQGRPPQPAHELVDSKSLVDIVIRDLWSDDEAILEAAMMKVSESIHRKDEAKRPAEQKEFFDVGGHLAVVYVMNQHPNCKVLQKLGIDILFKATTHNPQMKAVVAKVKGMQTILAAMSRYPSDKEVVRLAIPAFLSLISLRSNATLFATELDGVNVIIGTMKRFPSHVLITECSCRILLFFANIQQLRPSLFASKAISALATAVDTHTDHIMIQMAGRRALNKLTSSH